LRDLVGDTTPKFVCGQGRVRLLHGADRRDSHLACLTLAETVEGPLGATLDCHQDGRNFIPPSRLHEHFRRAMRLLTPGMLMAAKALLDHNPSPTPMRSSTDRGHICAAPVY